MGYVPPEDLGKSYFVIISGTFLSTKKLYKILHTLHNEWVKSGLKKKKIINVWKCQKTISGIVCQKALTVSYAMNHCRNLLQTHFYAEVCKVVN